MRVDLVKTFRFEAAHVSPKGRNHTGLHGHSYEVELVISGECDGRLGWLLDYADIAARFDPLFKMLDHRTLNHVEGMKDGSLADLRAWLNDRLPALFPEFKGVRVTIVGECEFNPILVERCRTLGLPPRLRFGFEAAHALPRLPETHKCRRMHGHSFAVEAAAPDLDRLKSALYKIYDALDHRCLNDIDGLENPTSEQTARWIWERLRPATPDLKAVVVAETCTARGAYYGE